MLGAVVVAFTLVANTTRRCYSLLSVAGDCAGRRLLALALGEGWAPA
jgi:hypothetical protein